MDQKGCDEVMSINSNTKSYSLQKHTQLLDEFKDPILSDLGIPTYDYIDIEMIDVSVNYVNSSVIVDGLLYKKIVPSGITHYNQFDLREDYRLKGNGQHYSIEGINQGGRRTILSLKEVLV